MAKHNEAGARAEQQAEQYLTRKGLIPVARNFLCKGGEIDLIMAHGHHLVFVEVRFRKSAAFGGAVASITASKQRKIITAAQNFLMENKKYSHSPCRFDVIAITGTQTEWIQNAFGAEE